MSKLIARYVILISEVQGRGTYRISISDDDDSYVYYASSWAEAVDYVRRALGPCLERLEVDNA